MLQRLFDKIYEYYRKKEEARILEKKEIKKTVINDLTRNWTDEEVLEINSRIHHDSQGLIAGYFTQYELKKQLLKSYKDYFTKEEYEQYLHEITIKEILENRDSININRTKK